MKAQLSSFLCAFLLIVIAPVNPATAVAQANLRTDTATESILISITVIVKDDVGRPIRELQACDFTVFDNDEPQRLLGFRAAAFRSENARYVLTFEAAHADRSGDYHTIDVRVNRPNLDVRTIKGYYPQMGR